VKKEWAEKVLKGIMAENFLNLSKDINVQIQEAERILNKINPKESSIQPSIVNYRCDVLHHISRIYSSCITETFCFSVFELTDLNVKLRDAFLSHVQSTNEPIKDILHFCSGVFDL